MKLVHRLVAYDRITERVVQQVDLSENAFETICAVAHVPSSYTKTFGSFQVAPSTVGDLAGYDLSDQFDWFLEASAVKVGADVTLDQMDSSLGR